MPRFSNRLLRATLLFALAAPSTYSAPRERKPDWLGTEMPLQLPVRTPADLSFKSELEREYLIFNLMASGKVAWDDKDYAGAAEKWEALLNVPRLDPEIDKQVRPYLIEARSRAGKPAAALPPPPVAPAPAPPAAAQPGDAAPTEAAPAAPRRRFAVVDGTITGGLDGHGGGTVITLHRLDGATPAPPPLKEARVVRQHEKLFVPHVTVVPAGSEVVFRNDETEARIIHEVFSLDSQPRFDTQFFGPGTDKSHVFANPGVAHLFCNIHAQMSAIVNVVDTPWYALSDATGAFKISGVPPGSYRLEAWNEGASKNTVTEITVKREPLHLQLAVASDNAASATVPDAQGKPRQRQLPY